MLTIQLQNLKFKAYHGLYEEEKILSNWFVVNATVKYNADNKVIDRIEDTINYENIFCIIKQRMSVPTELLETLAMQITEDVLDEFSQVGEVEISIAKQNPPIEKFIGNVVVSYHKKRN